MAEQTETRAPLDLDVVRRRFERFRAYEDAAGGPLTGAEHVTAIAAAWDVEPLLAAVERVCELADAMAAESPKPGVGGFLAEAIHGALGEVRAAAGGGAGNPTQEDQPPPTPDETGAEHG